MDLKDAVSIAAGYTGSDTPYNEIKFKDGVVLAWDRIRGVQITCTEIKGLTVSVPVAQLNKAIKGLRSPKVAKTKSTLKITDKGAAFTMKCTGAVPPLPVEIPASGWATWSPEMLAAVQAAAKIVGHDVPGHPILGGLHVSPQWVGGGNGYGAWVVWHARGGRSITIDASVVEKIDGATEIHVGDRYLHLRDQTEQVRWAIGMVGDYPAAAIESMVSAPRRAPDQVVVEIDPKRLGELLRTAVHAQTSPADVLALKVDASSITVVRPHDDAAGFEGSVDCKPVESHNRIALVGFDPGLLLKTLGLCVGEGPYYLKAGSKTDPVVVWGGSDPVIEAVLAAAYLPGGVS